MTPISSDAVRAIDKNVFNKLEFIIKVISIIIRVRYMKSIIFDIRHTAYILLIFCVFLLPSCAVEPVPVAVTSVTLNTSSMTLIEGNSQKLIATVSPTNAENKTVIWSTSNSNIAFVEDGLVTAINAGEAVITVKTDDGGKIAECNVIVSPRVYPVEGVTLDKALCELIEGEDVLLVATVTPVNATNKRVVWNSSNNKVATVADGKVTAIKAGKTTITATSEDGGKTAVCEVTVNALMEVFLDYTSAEMAVGEELYLTATVTPADAENRNVIWKSSDTSVATVSDGRVRALSPGVVTISAMTEEGAQTATCEITVTKYPRMDLSSSGTANCYIISEAGLYKFTPTQGNSSKSVGQIASAEILWETFGTDVTPNVGDLVKNVKFTDGFIHFEIPEIFKEGNAVIAAKDASDNILWSWHIWLTDHPDSQIYFNNAGIMMDRNLGATSATPGDVGALGLLYQWGRKDPFLGSSSIHYGAMEEAKSTISWPAAVDSDSNFGTIEYAIANPTTFITYNINNYDWHYTGSTSRDNTRWTESSSAKSMYDPCPLGWRVPDGGNKGVWSTALDTSVQFDYTYCNTDEGMDFSGKLGADACIWYPAAGYYDGVIGQLCSTGLDGYYWSASPSKLSRSIYSLDFFYYGLVYFSNSCERSCGHSLRCVQE